MNVRAEISDGVAVLQLTHPPVNSLDRVTRRELRDAVERAIGDKAVGAVVLWGGPDVFSAGADIGEFAGGPDGDAVAAPTLASVIDFLEGSPKPIVAAISGPCMGGGLEVALGCHVRLIGPSARIALPEIKLGLLPGAGGTQRLPRLIGARDALTMILSGESLSATRAVALGIGEAATGDLLSAAVGRARRLIGSTPVRVSTMVAAIPAVNATADFWTDQRSHLKSMLPASLRCIDAVRAATTMSFAAGTRLEAESFLELMRTPEARALQYAFFSDRRAGAVNDLPEDVRPLEVGSVGVVGAGTMGAGIAICALNAGLATVIVEAKPEALETGVARIRANFEQAVKKGRLDPAERDGALGRLTATTDLAALANVDLVIEAVFEDLDVKRQVFGELSRIAKPTAILASNTSTLDIDKIVSAAVQPGRTVGMHFFSPAHVMRLLEVVRGAYTTPQALATVVRLARRLGKTAVVARVCDGFIGNRMFEEYLRQAYFLLDEGATPLQLDTALEKWGMAMGPLAVMDLAGGDIGWAIRKRRAVERPVERYSAIPDRICELGRFGQKTRAGYYRYDDRGRRIPDPMIDDLIVAYSKESGIARRTISDEEIVAKCVLALVNEGAKLLSEGIAQRASDIDVVYRNGYGFPGHRGGPMYFADEIGLDRVTAHIDSFRKGYQGQSWELAPLIAECLKRGSRLSNA
jgi:3-hydroxyacyl-CoA dehydrogenase